MGLQSAIASDFGTAPTTVTLTASTPTRLTTARTSAKSGVYIHADTANGSPVYFGDEHVDASHWTAVLEAHDSPLTIPLADASKVYAYTTGSGQRFGWSAI